MAVLLEPKGYAFEPYKMQDLLAALDPSSPTGQVLAEDVEFIRVKYYRALHHPGCLELPRGDPKFKTVPLRDALANGIDEWCISMLPAAELCDELIWLREITEDRWPLPSTVQRQDDVLRPLLVDDLAPLEHLLDASQARSKAFSELVAPHAEALLDLAASVVSFDEMTYLTEVKLGDVDPSALVSADPFLLELIRFQGGGATPADPTRGPALAHHHRTRPRTEGTFLVHAPNAFSYCSVFRDHLGHAAEAFVVPDHPGTALVPGSTLPLFSLVPGAQVLPAAGVTPEVLEAFTTLVKDRLPAEALEQALAL